MIQFLDENDKVMINVMSINNVRSSGWIGIFVKKFTVHLYMINELG